MKHLVVMLTVALVALMGCEQKSAEKAETENTEEAAATEEAEKAEETQEEETTDEPKAPAESGATDKQGAMPADMKPGEIKHFGSRFTVIEPPVTLASAIEKSGEYEGPYKVEATVEKVCKKKGCWFTLSGEGVDRPVRVRMKDYGFFVPKNADGALAIVEGNVTAREIPQKEAQHYADDEAAAGEEPRKVEGPEKVYEFTATAVEVRVPNEG